MYELEDVPSQPLDEMAVLKFSQELARKLIKTWPKELETAVARRSTCIIFAYGKRMTVTLSSDEDMLGSSLIKSFTVLAESKSKIVRYTTTQMSLI